MLYVTTPYLISTFTGNVNNFNVIYLLSGGDPVTDLSSTAGKTDLLVTWLYKLTIDKQYYNIGAVIGILTFVILAIGRCLHTGTANHTKKKEGSRHGWKEDAFCEEKTFYQQYDRPCDPRDPRGDLGIPHCLGHPDQLPRGERVLCIHLPSRSRLHWIIMRNCLRIQRS